MFCAARVWWLLTVGLLLLVAVDRADAVTEFDIVIKAGRIVDGTGAPWFVADVGIRDGKIVAIGRIDSSEATSVIDAHGLIVAPGFVDMMGQSATPLLDDPSTALNLLTQGITTINAGEGRSAAPLADGDGDGRPWTTMAEYFALLESGGLPVNVAQTVGHTQVRLAVLGEDARRPSEAELDQMRSLVREAMEAGAIGVSTALIYPPAVYAQTQEISALAAVAGEFGGRYYTHMRNEGDKLLEAIDEALDIGHSAKTPVHIFHLKAAGQQNWGKMQQAISRIKAARAAGQQVTADIYPYVNNGLGIAALIHPDHFQQGEERLRGELADPAKREQIRREMESSSGWENWFRHVGHDWTRVVIGRADADKYASFGGQSVADIAVACGEDPWETFFELVKTGAFALPQSMSEANKILAMQEEFVSFCTDVGPAAGGRSASHPRAFGSFPRLLSRYVRDLGVMSLERAVAQASAAAANNILAYDRGRLAEGLAADIVVFDYDTLQDTATFEDPDSPSEGVKHVLVNGVLVLKDGALTGRLPGRLLRGPGYRKDQAASVVSTGALDQRLVVFDQTVREFLTTHRVPGAAVALVDHGRLVLAKGYGYADVASRERVEPTSLFRIASISKPITAIAILQLVEKSLLNLDDKVFDVLDVAADVAEAGDAFDKRQMEITIRHLLHHTGGWDRGTSFDPMFRSVQFANEFDVPSPAGTREIIRAMLRRPLDFNPGERYAYSNYGYCLLGRVIERVSGQGYEEYCQQHVLSPLGITSMHLGKTRLEERRVGEVRYYDSGWGRSVFQADLLQRCPRPYGAWNLEAMDAHGGWLASSVDLARLAGSLSDPDRCPLLSRESIEQMHGPPVGLTSADDGSYYSMGWMNRRMENEGLSHWHTGSLPGTAAILIRRFDGRDLIVLFNTRTSPSSDHLGRDADALLHEAADRVDAWPKTDLFAEFESRISDGQEK